MVTKRLAGPALLTGSAATIYTVPAGKRALVRQIHLFNNDAGSIAVTVSVGADAAGTRLLDGYVLATKTGYDLWLAPLALEAGETLQAFGGTTLKISSTVMGAEEAV